MSPVRGSDNDDQSYHEPRPDDSAFEGIAGDPEAMPDAFDAPLSDLKETLTEMTRSLGQLLEDEEVASQPPAPVAELADGGQPPPQDEDVEGGAESAASRVALGLAGDDDAVEASPEQTDAASEEPSLLGMKMLEADLDEDVNDNAVADRFEDDLPEDGDDGGGLEFANLDFDSD